MQPILNTTEQADYARAGRMYPKEKLTHFFDFQLLFQGAFNAVLLNIHVVWRTVQEMPGQ
jgi:hypothetical protein